jgi:hypothetical protein
MKAFLKNFALALAYLSWVGFLGWLQWATMDAFKDGSHWRYPMLASLVVCAALTVAAVWTALGLFQKDQQS